MEAIQQIQSLLQEAEQIAKDESKAQDASVLLISMGMAQPCKSCRRLARAESRRQTPNLPKQVYV